MIDEKTVRHIAHLARIGVSDEEVKTFTQELGAVLEFVEKLSEISTQTIGDDKRSARLVSAVREDIVPRHSNDKRLPQAVQMDHLEEQAPGYIDGEIHVPRILE